jgi:hypothetical protein
MKSARFLVLLAMTGTVPGILLQAMGQQEIDPEHFDRAEPAKTATHSKAGTKTTTLKSQPKSIGHANNGSRTMTRQDQHKAESQRITTAKSTGEQNPVAEPR